MRLEDCADNDTVERLTDPMEWHWKQMVWHRYRRAKAKHPTQRDWHHAQFKWHRDQWSRLSMGTAVSAQRPRP